MALFHNHDDEDVYKDMSAEEGSRKPSFFKTFGTAFVMGLQNIWKQIQFLIAKIRHDDEVLWDDGANGNIENTEDFKMKLMNIVFIVYGVVAGFFCQNYSAFLIRRFSAWATGVNLTSDHIPTNPLTVIMAAIIIFFVYLAALVIAGLFYWVFKLLFEHDFEDGKQVLQIGYAYSVLAMLVVSLICLVIPGNVFMWFL